MAILANDFINALCEAFKNNCSRVCFKAVSTGLPFALDLDIESDKLGDLP